ncbi:serine hydrolase domain-containing protein [Glaciecola petra]|uniref:Serine hydrolase domain-containing protein n=1 Tax=Glaciecola petra TaxID=3075602 RepID=A0ABU2ZUH9_9ALTE|nr:serine hydrolase domain-containing protein [Aestuariibacter sp. P117]MDT0596060.1 serine hydrolase domain-containing protein [Aestuariibacter sp. P117]
MFFNVKGLLPAFLVNSILLFLLCGLSKAFAEADGNWRGELVIQDNIVLPIGLVINTKNNTLSLDSPIQEMLAHVPSKFSVEGNKVSFNDENLKATFEGEIVGDVLEGVFTQGKSRPLTLHRLKQKDLNRMSFEGKYSGDLVINSENSLPIVLRVAVIKNGYSGVLDSPAQNSFGIPVQDIKLDNTSLSFSSKMLNATFAGKSNTNSEADMAYAGTFIQGMPMSLTLTKVTPENASQQFKTPTFGEKGGSIAIISPNKSVTRFFQNTSNETRYEIGSVTKTFTAYLLAKQVVSEKLSLDSHLETVFPIAANSKNNKINKISMQSLAAHISGLERNPPSLENRKDPRNPFADITQSQLSEDLKNTQLGKTSYQYSNFAYAILGEALAINERSTFAAEISEHILNPLAMNNTYVASDTSSDSDKLITGYTQTGQSVIPWHFGAASGAGAIVSNIDDMIAYTNHMMTIAKENTSLATLLFTPVTSISCCEQGLAWLIMEDSEGKKFAWHNGMTGGFSSFLGFYLDGSRAVVLLNNQAVSIDALGHKLLTDTSVNIQEI